MANDLDFNKIDRQHVFVDKRVISAYQRVLDVCDAQKPIEYYTKRPDIEKQYIEDIIFHTFEKKVEDIVVEAIKKNENRELRKEDVIPSLFSLLERIEQFNSHTTGRYTSDLSFDLTFASRYRKHICYVAGNLEEYTEWLRPLSDIPQNNAITAITKERKNAFFSSVLDLINAPADDVVKIRNQSDVETAAMDVENVFKEAVEEYTATKLYTNMSLDNIGKKLSRLAYEVEKFDPILAVPYKAYINDTLENMPAYEAWVRTLYEIPQRSIASVQRHLVPFDNSDYLGYKKWFAKGEKISIKNESALAENTEIIALRNVIHNAKKPATTLDSIFRTAGHVMMAGAAAAFVSIGAFFGYTQTNREEVIENSNKLYTNNHPNQTVYTTPKIGHADPEPVKIRNNPKKTAPETIHRLYEVKVPIFIEQPNADSLSLVRPAKVQVIDRRLEKMCEEVPIQKPLPSHFHYRIYCGLL